MTQKKTSTTKSNRKEKKVPVVIKAEDQPVVVATSDYPYAKWKFETFNPVQSRIMDFYDKDVNGLIAAMTSAGKTVVAEMFLAQEIRKRGGKGMFLAPLRALAREKITDWKNENYHFADQKISICTGDYRLTKERAKELNDANLIIMTSEMLNHRSRNHKAEQNNWLLDVGTLIIDECLSPNAIIETDQGPISIGDIIDKNLDVKVASMNHSTKQIVFKKIVARQKKLLKRRWHTIYYDGGHISATSNHLVWCENRGYIPSKDIQEGDVIYVRGINEERKTSNIGNFTGRRFDSSTSARKVSKIEGSTVFGSKGFSRMEVQRVEAIGWHPSTNQTEPRVRKGSVQIQHIVKQNVVGNTFDVLSTREENSKFSVVGRDHRSGGIGGVVHGRRKPGSKYDGNSHRGLSQIRSGIVSALVGNEMVGGLRSLSDKTILATQISSEGSGSFSRTGSSRNNFRHELQGAAKNGADILFDVWSEIHRRSPQSSSSQEGHALWGQGVSVELGQDVQPDGDMDSEESWCCDLEVESDCFEDCNFFADGVLVHNSHLLTVPGRGDHLEVGLMKFTEINPKARLVLLSATMPNVEEIADWISYSLTKRETFMLRSKYRPVPLTLHYESYYDVGRYDQVEEEKVNKALEIIEWYPDDKFLVFAHTKRTGELMKQNLRSLGIEAQFHNADLQADERAKVEDRFKTDPKLRVIVATSTLAWGLNLPARRVIILGVNRGIGEVETHDILQMVGRSGRLGIDPMGDAYILVPESEEAKYRQKFSKPNRIESQLLEKVGDKYKVLAFHLVSEIHHGTVSTTDDVHAWYKRSLAYFQNKALDETVVDQTLDLLRKCSAVWKEDAVEGETDEKWICRPIGKVSSMFYFSPFDVSDLYFNFKNLFQDNKEDDDYFVSTALGNIDGQRMNIVSRIEKEEMSLYAAKVRTLMPGKFFNDASLKASFCYFNLLNGVNSQACATTQRNLQFDFNRLSQVLQSLDTFGGNWQRESYFKILEGRITNGVPVHLVDLCRLANIGKARATKLYEAGFKTVESVADMDFENFKKIVNSTGKSMKVDAAKEVFESAKVFALL